MYGHGSPLASDAASFTTSTILFPAPKSLMIFAAILLLSMPNDAAMSISAPTLRFCGAS